MTVEQAIQSVSLDVDEIKGCLGNINGLSEIALAGNTGLHDQIDYLLTAVDTKRYDSHFKARFISDEVKKLAKQSSDAADSFAKIKRESGDLRYAKWVEGRYQIKLEKASTKLIGVIDDELNLLKKTGKYEAGLKLTKRLAIAEKYANKAGKILAALDLGMSAGDFLGTWIADGYPDQERFDIMAGKGAGIAVAYLNPVIGASILISDISGLTDGNEQALVDVYNAYNAEAISVSDWINNIAKTAYQAGFFAESTLTAENFNYLNDQFTAKVDRLSNLDFFLVLGSVLDSPYIILNGKQQFMIKLQSDFETKLKYFRQINMVDVATSAYTNGAADRMAEEANKQAAEVKMMDEIFFKAKQLVDKYVWNADSSLYLEIQASTTVRALSLGDLLRLTPADKVRLYPRNDTNWPDFKALTGTITVWLLHKNGEMYSVPGTLLDDGGVEFSTTASMPVDSYFTVYMVSSNDNGVKISAPIYQTSQVVEFPDSATTGGGSSGSSTTGIITLPRTGQYRCYDSAGTEIPCAGTGQDGDIQAGKRWTLIPRFADNGDQTMTDTVTGLIWPKDGGTPTFGTCTGGAMPWQGALNYVDCLNNNNYLNHNDWRLPNHKELESIVNRQQVNNVTWLNNQGFSVAASRYWSSSTLVAVPYVAWGVYIEEGVPSDINKNDNLYSWPVRGGDAGGDVQLSRTGQTVCYNTDGTVIDCTMQGQTQDAAMGKGVSWSPASRFTDNHDGTVTDNLTGLIWLQNANCVATAGGIAKTGELTWGDALIWSKGLSSGACGLSDGSTVGDWRMPNVAELESLVDLQRYHPALPTGHPFSNVLPFGIYYAYFWSSSSVTSNSFLTDALVVNVGYNGGVGQPYKGQFCNVWPVRGGHLDSLKTYPATATFISENLPDGSYQVGAATKAWRFKSGTSAINGLKAVRVSLDDGLGITQAEIDVGNVAANTDFLVYLPINPVHDSTSIKSSYWKLVDSNGEIITITNSKSGQFWLKIKTNRPPEFNQLQLDSVAGRTNEPTSLQILASDPDGDNLSYSVVTGGGSVIDGSWYGKPAKLFQHTFTSAGIFPITIQVNDGHGDVAQYTVQAVIAPNGTIANFYQDVPFPAGGDPAQWCDNSVPPVFTPNRAQYLAINYLTLNGITIGRPDKDDPTKRVFEGCNFAKQAEALAMIMKTAASRGFIELDAEMRYLPNLVKIDTANGVYDNFSWAAPYVLKAESLGLIDSADTFDPSMLATRGWMARMISRMMRLNPPMDIIDPATFVFADSASFSTTDNYDNARSAAYFGYMGSLGASSSFNPSEPMIRADLAMVTARILRTPTVTGISTSGLTDQALYGRTMPALVHGLSFNVTDVTGLVAHRMTVDTSGNVGEEITNPATYTTATVIRPGVGSAAGKLIYSLAQTPVSVPTNPPDISLSETRSLVVMLESPDNDGNNPVRSIYRMEYGVIFPDQDGDGVRDTLDLWPDNPLYAVDTNANGIPDNADALWGLTNRNGSEQIKISGQVMTLQNAVLSGQYAQMMNDASPPTVVSAIPSNGSQDRPLTQALSITFSRELDASTITSGTATLTNTTTSAAVAGTISYSLGVLTFTPSSVLSYANDYQFRLTTGIKDLAGHPLAADYLLTFKTEPQNFPPTGTININGGGLYTSTPVVSLAITAADPDGVPWMCISETGSCPGWIPFNATSTFTLTGSAGAKTISIWFSDGKNLANSTPAATASITYDNTAPTLTLSTLADGAVTRENQVNVTGVARDNVGSSGVASVTVNGKPVEFNSVNGIFSYPLPLMSASTPITVVTADQAGNSATVTQTVNRDQTAPLLTIDTPTDYSASSTALLTVSGTVEAGATVSVSLNGAAPVAASVTGTSYTAQVTLVSTTTLNTIQVTAAGLSGKNSSVKRSVRYNNGRWNMDVTDPPQDTLTSSGTYLLKGRVSNVVNAPLTITITRGADTYTPTVTDGAFEQLVTLPSDGLHVFSVLGTDSLGNKLSVTRVFNKGDFEQPVISQFSMPPASSSFTVPLTFTASDNVGITGWCQVYGTATVANSCVWSSTQITSRTFNSQGLKTITGFVKDAAGNISAPAIATTSITVADQPMTVTLAGTGNGTVTSNPAGISCISGSTAGCSASFTAGPAVSLLQTPQSDSTFGGWSGNCTGTGACNNAMTAAKSVTATFNLIPRAMIGSTGYASLGLAYSSVAPGDTATILVLGIDLDPEILTVDNNRKISLIGGYTSSYDKGATPTSLKSPLTISTGSLTVEGVVVK